MMDTCHHTFVQICRRYNVKVSLNVNYRLGLMMMCQYRFISCNECATLVKDVDNGARYVYVRRGDIWAILCLLLNISGNLKLP